MSAISFDKNEFSTRALKFVLSDGNNLVGRAFLYIIKNDLHAEPYGLLEDVFVNEDYRGQGHGTKLVEAVVAEAKKIGCTKLIATSRHERISVHEWYKRLGFVDFGIEFRMDFKQ